MKCGYTNINSTWGKAKAKNRWGKRILRIISTSIARLLHLTISQLDGTLSFSVFVYLFWFASIAYFSTDSVRSHHSVRCSMRWKDFRLVIVIVVIFMCSINNQLATKSKEEKNRTKSYKCNRYLPTDLCHAFSVIFFSCQFLFFFCR